MTKSQNLEQLVQKMAEQNLIKYTLKEEMEEWAFDDPKQGRIEIYHRPGMGGYAGIRFRASESILKALEDQYETQAQQFYEAKTGKTTAEKFNAASEQLKSGTLDSLLHSIIARNLVKYEEIPASKHSPDAETAYTFHDPENHNIRIYHRPGMGGMPMVEFRGSQEFTSYIEKLAHTQQARFNAMSGAKQK